MKDEDLVRFQRKRFNDELGFVERTGIVEVRE